VAENDGIRPDWINKDYYAELGVKKDASSDDIKKAYRKLARANHPDSNPGDDAKHEKFKKVAEAYDVVGDPEKRKKYDEVRTLGASGGFPGGFGGTGAGRGYNFDDLFGAGGTQTGGLGDMFGDLFGGAGGAGGAGGGFGGRRTTPRPRPIKGADVETSATIGFTDALDGVTISLRLTSDSACPDCNGTGGKPGTKPRVCPECEGAGYVVNSVGGAFSMNEACPTCRGSGRGTSARTIQARIPAGVKDRQRIRLKGKGAAGESGGPSGDLYVTVHVTPHRVFGRKDDNLTIDVPVGFDELALGAEVKLPTLSGSPVTLRIPAGTPNGRTFRVRGKGFRRADGTVGDLLATVEVHVPAVLDADTKAAVEAYRAAMAGKPLRTSLLEES
jgi:molecular chaperone DnaJ